MKAAGQKMVFLGIALLFTITAAFAFVMLSYAAGDHRAFEFFLHWRYTVYVAYLVAFDFVWTFVGMCLEQSRR